MTPGARVAAAIEVLDDIAQGLAAEQALTRWGRRSRFAGSKDRAAVRDHVFDVMRCRRTAEHYGQGTSGRALMIGLLHQQGADLGALFNAVGHAPAPLDIQEQNFPPAPAQDAVNMNLPDWIVPLFASALGTKAAQTAQALQGRAPVTLRVNLAKTDVPKAKALLAEEGIVTAPNPLASAALTIVEGPRKLRNSKAFQEGHVELQDAASQAVVACLSDAARVLDYCAGGGGKTLALAMRPDTMVFAHDADVGRMADLPARMTRAGTHVTQLETSDLVAHAPFDAVLCDAPCSGSGAWRRAPEGKWLLTPQRLENLTQIQDDILDAACGLVAQGGVLAYATCSMFEAENEARITAFLARHDGWRCDLSKRFDVCDDGDGFFVAHLTRDRRAN